MNTESPSHRNRFWMLSGLIFASFFSLGYRLVDLQVLRHDSLSDLAQKYTQRAVMSQPRRGDIRDVRGNLLATSVPVKTVYADPVLVGDRQLEVARVLAPILDFSENDLVRRLQPQLRTNESGAIRTNRYVVLKHQVALETWAQVTQAMCALTFGIDERNATRRERQFFNDLRHSAISSFDGQLRVYPSQTLASHVLGYVALENREVNGRDVLEMMGRDGVESSMNRMLSGFYGYRLIQTDRKKEELAAMRNQDVAPHHGYNVFLTIDSRLQDIVEAQLQDTMREHSPISASAILVRPRTGEILAMCSLPAYDPSHPGGAPMDYLRNRIISDMIEPGSTFKVVPISSALNEGIVKLDELIDCEHGHFVYAGRALREHESHGYGLITVGSIIAHSSNIGAAKIGLRLGEPRFYSYMRAYGFGSRTGIPLPGEIAGLVHPVKDWSKLSITRVSMGHEVAVTPLQMVMAVAAIANGGRLMQPMLIDHLEDQDGNVVTRYLPQSVRQVVSESTAKQMVTALKMVVSTNGTAVKAHMDYYTVAGKTGTAQKAGPGGYMPGKYFASFIGFFPADQPELCLAVVLDEPKKGYYGGLVAAPCFHEIAERAAAYLGLRPEPALMEAMALATANKTGKGSQTQ
jgi:cell division protein FtsI/penicillin-binding protein 2